MQTLFSAGDSEKRPLVKQNEAELRIAKLRQALKLEKNE